MSGKCSPGENKNNKKSSAGQQAGSDDVEKSQEIEKADKVGETEKTQQGGNP